MVKEYLLLKWKSGHQNASMLVMRVLLSAMEPPVALVLAVFRSCWKRFYQWKQIHDTHVLSSLMCNSPLTYNPVSAEPAAEVFPVGTEAVFMVAEYDPDSDSDSVQYTLDAEHLDVESIQPHPAYDSCTPATRGIMVGDDSHYMPFIPYSDDPTFDHELQMQHYNFFSWQSPDDPDWEAICTQAVKELTNDHGLTLQQIIDTKIMPPGMTRKITSYLGARRREYPEWPPENPLHACNVPYEPHHTNAPPSQILNDLLQYFCTNRNCLHGYCVAHIGELPLPPSILPTLSNEALYSSVTEPCGKQCFILGHHSDTISYWSEEDLDMLHTTLKYTPDTLPCDLAVIVRKPCKEVAVRRERWLASQIHNLPAQPKPPSRKTPNPNKLEFNDFDSDNFTPNYLCSHEGPCDASANCPCALNDAHCIGACKCSKKCIRKWRGCTCTKSRSNKTCGTDRCPCYRAHRECDPDLCLKCEARDPTTDVCKNATIQHMRHKHGVVHRSKWGLGYYLAEAAREGELITEYVGDLIYELTTKSRDPVAAHANRQYMFKLNSTLSIDGTTIGNESRYINHASGDQVNVRAYVRLVNGEHRIGIFAVKDIEPGSELFLDYGSEFFHAYSQSTSSQSTTGTTTLSKEAETSPQVLSLSFYQPRSPTPQPRGKEKERGKTRNGKRRLTDLTLKDEDEGSEYKGSDSELSSGSDI